jgi:glycosyltransferase involved in cell wall biosynthesis
MKILTGIDVPFAPFGGSLICCDDWYSNLPDGVEVRFLTLPPPEGQEKWWSIEDVVMLDIQKARTQDGFLEYVDRLQKAVEEQIEDFKPDVIHCQHLNYGLSRAIANIQTDIPRIGICHGTDVQTAVANEFFKENLTKICDAMDLLLFPNQHMTDDFFKVYGKPKSHLINPLGIPDRFFDNVAQRPTYDGSRPLQLLYAGRLLEWKGPDIAVESMDHVKQPVELTVIGNEDQKGFKQRLTDFVVVHHLEDRITFKDQLPREELLRAFRDFDAIVFPSRKLEAFSLTVVEAQAVGLPVIYFPGGGITDTVGDSGIVITDNTPEGLARLLDEIHDRPELLQDAQQAGYRNAERYRISTSRKKLFDITETIVTDRRAS